MFNADNSLELHGLIGGKESPVGFDKMGKFEYYKTINNLSEELTKQMIRGERVLALGDKGYMWFNSANAQIYFSEFGSDISKDIANDRYNENVLCYLYGIEKGFVGVYSTNASDSKNKYYQVTLYNETGNVQRRHTIHLVGNEHINKVPGIIVQDSANKNIIVICTSDSYNSVSFVYIYDDSLQFKESFEQDSLRTISGKYPSIMAYDGWLFGTNTNGTRYSKYNYLGDRFTSYRGIGFSSVDGISMMCSPIKELLYNPATGKVYGMENMNEIGNYRTVRISNPSGTDVALQCANHSPNPKNGFILSNQEGSNLIEVNYDGKRNNSSYAPANPNVRLMTEIADLTGKTSARTFVSTSGKTLLRHQGSSYTVDREIMLYRR